MRQILFIASVVVAPLWESQCGGADPQILEEIVGGDRVVQDDAAYAGLPELVGHGDVLPGTPVQEDDVGILCYHFFEVGVGVASDYGDRAVVLPGDQSVGVVAVPVGTHDVIQSAYGTDGLGDGGCQGDDLQVLAHGILAELGVAVVGESGLVDGRHHGAACTGTGPGDYLLIRYVVS